jgi:DNA helicase-2/ATP-dependent DNA helicase PcrA
MKERFWRLAGETLPVSFGTFHSVFFTILKYAYHYSADNILPEHKKYDFIREIITDHELEIDDEADFMRQIIQEISLVKGQMIPLAYYHSGCCGDEVFKEIYRAYEEKLHENRWIDFDDILVYTYELLKEREDIRKAWQQKFPYILIDEFQDINKIQYEIVKMLAGETKNLFIVGDDDQSIYKFRGARPELMLNFQNVLYYKK